MGPGASAFQERGGDGGYCQRRDDFLEALRELCAGLDDRRLRLEAELRASAAKSEGAQRVYREVWIPRLQDLSHRVEALRSLALVRPTVCLMGRRGAGKTTLLQNWLGNTAKGGIEELRFFPTGQHDTTAALVRLTPVTPRSPWNPDSLHLSLLGPGDLPEVVESRPPRPSWGEKTSLHLLKQVDPSLAERVGAPRSGGKELPYNVCRFPDDNRDKLFSLRGVDNHHEIAGQYDGAMPLPSVQWHTWQVVAPVNLVPGAPQGWAERVLSVVDVVDAPGADSQTQGEFPEWKRHKNRYVFERGIKELDVLLLVASSEAAGAQLGGQFQKEIWEKWLERCGTEGSGRLFLVFSRAFEFIREAATALGEEDLTSGNENLDAAGKIWKNVLEPLATTSSGRPSLIQPQQLESWPPFFFYDKNPRQLDAYPGEIGPGEGAAVAERLVALLDSAALGADEVPSDLPLGQRCILRIALDWGNWGRNHNHWNIRSVQAWTIRALCALFDPEDRGFGLLTETLERYTVGGPVARNHGAERRRAVDSLFDDFCHLLNAMETPQENATALKDLDRAQALIRAWREGQWRGVDLRLGSKCQRRIEVVVANSSPLQQHKTIFSVEDVVRDVVDDCVDRLKNVPRVPEEAEVSALKNVFCQCVLQDEYAKKIFMKEADVVSLRKDVLRRWQAIVLERLARVVMFLADADEDALRAAARCCFGVDMDAADLFEDLRQGGGLAVTEHDRNLLEKVRKSFEAMEKSMAAVGFHHPFAPQKLLADQEFPGEPQRSEPQEKEEQA